MNSIVLLICIITSIFTILLMLCLFRTATEEYKNIDYTPILINKEINLFYIPNFLTAEECDHLIRISQNKFTRSGITINEKNGYGDHRTSETHYFHKGEDNIIKNIEERASLVVNKPIECIESLQIVKYEDGQEFKEHYDWFNMHYKKAQKGNQRQYTFFVYLNDVENGGYTRFPKLNLTFKPKKGAALFWQNCRTHDICFQNSLHLGEPPIGDTKYGLNIWIDFDPIKTKY